MTNQKQCQPKSFMVQAALVIRSHDHASQLQDNSLHEKRCAFQQFEDCHACIPARPAARIPCSLGILPSHPITPTRTRANKDERIPHAAKCCAVVSGLTSPKTDSCCSRCSYVHQRHVPGASSPAVSRPPDVPASPPASPIVSRISCLN